MNIQVIAFIPTDYIFSYSILILSYWGYALWVSAMTALIATIQERPIHIFTYKVMCITDKQR